MAGEREPRRDKETQFVSYLKAKGMRITTERLAVLRASLAMSPHFTADRLLDAVRQQGMAVSMATVYNTLSLLIDCGMLRVSHREREATYEYADQHTVHLICRCCGKVKGIRDKGLEKQLKLRRFPSFTMQWHVIDVYGLCSACSRKSRTQGRGKEIRQKQQQKLKDKQPN